MTKRKTNRRAKSKQTKSKNKNNKRLQRKTHSQVENKAK